MSRAAPILHPLAPLCLIGLLGGCGVMDAYRHDRDPGLSGMQLDASTMPETTHVQVPMPPPEPKQTLLRAEAASLWQPGSRGFFGEQRATKVGDILTVIININDQAQLANASDRSRSEAQNMGFPTFFGFGNQIAKVLPGTGTAALPTTGDIVDLGSSSSASGSGTIKRNEAINLKVAALVIQKLANGDLVLAGRQEVKVNSELRELRVAGIIRPQDISMDNTIPYEKIAEARIAYGGRGQLSRVQQPRYGQDFLDVTLPY